MPIDVGRVAMVAAICLALTTAGPSAIAQSLNKAPAVSGSGCAQAVEAWKGLSSSNSVEALKGFRAGVPKTCPDQVAKANARIAKLEADELAEQQAADRHRKQAAARTQELALIEERERIAGEKRRVAAEESRRLENEAQETLAKARAEGRIAYMAAVDAATTSRPVAERAWRDVLSNGSLGPEMLALPAGSIVMVSKGIGALNLPSSTKDRVNIQGLFVSKSRITLDDWRKCHDANVCNPEYDLKVSWDEAQTYVDWLSKETGRSYRLLSESEWEYAAKAGSATSASSGPNAFGLSGMPTHGVYEWVQDCWTPEKMRFPADGSAYDSTPCISKIVKGGYNTSISGRNTWPANSSNGSEFRIALTY